MFQREHHVVNQNVFAKASCSECISESVVSRLFQLERYVVHVSTTASSGACFSESVVSCMANIHSYVLSDCRQTKWAGDTSEELTITQIKQHEKKRDILKTNTQKYPNRPYSKVIMMENIK